MVEFEHISNKYILEKIFWISIFCILMFHLLFYLNIYNTYHTIHTVLSLFPIYFRWYSLWIWKCPSMKFPGLRNNHPNLLRCTQHICPDTMAHVSVCNVRISPLQPAMKLLLFRCVSGNSVCLTWLFLPYNCHLAVQKK